MERLRILGIELKKDWDAINLAAKFLVLVAILLMIIIIYFTIDNRTSVTLLNKIQVVFRSSFASVFGFILSSNTKNTCKTTLDNSMNRLIKHPLDDKEIEEKIIEYNYGDGNTVQILISFVTFAISAMVIFWMYKYDTSIDSAIVSQFRDLMCSSIGFLLGESKIKSA